jgi:hypothetical protein
MVKVGRNEDRKPLLWARRFAVRRMPNEIRLLASVAIQRAAEVSSFA